VPAAEQILKFNGAELTDTQKVGDFIPNHSYSLNLSMITRQEQANQLAPVAVIEPPATGFSVLPNIGPVGVIGGIIVLVVLAIVIAKTARRWVFR
jgi:hypothetical protein